MDLIKDLLTVIGALATCAGVMWGAFKSAKVKEAVSDTEIVTTEAQCKVIEMLREEVERMSSSNAKLGSALAEFQLENVALRREISELHDTINQLSERLNAIQRNTDIIAQPE
ncbi:MAG: hypothetical protein ACXWAT_00980 [Methylobacter sp.]